MGALLLFGCSLVFSLRARAEIPPELMNRPVMEIHIGGESARIAEPRELGIAEGTPLTRELVRRAIFRLLESGRWIDVQVDAEAVPDGVMLIFDLEPRITLLRVQIQGNVELEEQAIRDVLGTSQGAEVKSEDFEAMATRVRMAYAARGYLGARATVRFRDTDNPSLKVLMVELDEGAPTRITEVVFEGFGPRDPVRLRDAMGISLSDVLDRRGLGESAERGEQYLRRHGYLEASIGTPVVTIRGQHAKVAFPTYVGPHYTREVVGASPLLPRDVITAALPESERLSEESLTAMPARVKELYARHGFLDARVSVMRELLVPRRKARLLVQVAPGKPIEILDVSFTGARHFPQGFLRDQVWSYLEEDLPGGALIETVDSEVADAITGGDLSDQRHVPRPTAQSPRSTYYEPTYLEAIKHLTELYQAEGFLSVKISPPQLERVGETRATVNIPVEEGPRTLLYSVSLKGQKLVSGRELLVASGLVRNAPFSYLTLEEARLRIQSLYHERGHMFARIEPSVRFSSDRTRAEVTILIVERYPVRVGQVVIRGNERTSTGFLESLLELHEGDLYQPSKARQSERALQSLGVFTGVSVALDEPDLPAQVKTLLVTVSERKNQFLDFSAGVSTGQGVRAGFEYGYRNLLGRAVGLSLRVQFAHQLFFVREELRARFSSLSLEKRLERNVALGTVIPRLPGLGSTRTAIDLVHVRDNERDFGLDKNGVTLTFTETPWQHVTLMQAADLENNSVDLFVAEALNDYLAMTRDPRLRRLLRVPEGNTTLVAVRLGATYDKRDSPFVPTRGYFASAASELASTLDSETIALESGHTQFVSRFLKLQVMGSGYVPLGRSIVLAGQARIGRVLHLIDDSKTYPNRAFFLGGVDTMRGYFQDELIPQDVADEILADPNLTPNSIVRNGDSFLLVKGELRFPVYGDLGGALFADIGNLWADPGNFNPFDLRPTAGAGVRIATPVGPIALDYGIVLKRRPGLGEPFGTLHFSIGLF